VIAIDTVEAIGGELPRKQLRLVMAWAEIHREELLQINSPASRDLTDAIIGGI